MCKCGKKCIVILQLISVELYYLSFDIFSNIEYGRRESSNSIRTGYLLHTKFYQLNDHLFLCFTWKTKYNSKIIAL